MGIGIRESVPEDAADLLDIWRRAVAATHHFLSQQDRRELDGVVADYIATETFLVAFDPEGRPQGFLGGSGCEIDALFVAPEVHGRGIGTALLEHFAALAGEPLAVDVNEQNALARAFYESRGFRVVGRSDRDRENRPYPLLRLTR